MNTQPISKIVKDPSPNLQVIKIWRTIQGEGPLAGSPATFVRLAGCNLCCPACDTEYTNGAYSMSPNWIAREVFLARNRLVVITGGEPYRQNIKPTVDVLLGNGFNVQLETNGTHYREILPEPEMGTPDGDLDEIARYLQLTIVVSPKTPFVDPRFLQHTTSHFKYVVRHGEVNERGLPQSVMGNKMGVFHVPPDFDATRVYIQPLDEGQPGPNELNVKQAVEVCMKFGYILSLQTHKLIGVE